MSGQGYSIFALTGLTGRRSNDIRSTVVLGFDTSWRVAIIVIVSTVVGLFLTMLLWLPVGQYAILAVPTSIGAGLFLFQRRSNKGMRRRTYEEGWDVWANRKTANQFVVFGRYVVGVDDEPGVLICQNTVPTPGGLVAHSSLGTAEGDVDEVADDPASLFHRDKQPKVHQGAPE